MALGVVVGYEEQDTFFLKNFVLEQFFKNIVLEQIKTIEMNRRHAE